MSRKRQYKQSTTPVLKRKRGYRQEIVDFLGALPCPHGMQVVPVAIKSLNGLREGVGPEPLATIFLMKLAQAGCMAWGFGGRVNPHPSSHYNHEILYDFWQFLSQGFPLAPDRFDHAAVLVWAGLEAYGFTQPKAEQAGRPPKPSAAEPVRDIIAIRYREFERRTLRLSDIFRECSKLDLINRKIARVADRLGGDMIPVITSDDEDELNTIQKKIAKAYYRLPPMTLDERLKRRNWRCCCIRTLRSVRQTKRLRID